jgi:nucleoside-diphosphate-sugar epimerase
LRALVTGANGFIGRYVCERLQQAGHRVRASVRTASAGGFPHDELHVSGDLDATTSWGSALEEVDAVFHIAGLAHLVAPPDEQRSRFAAVNRGGTESLARAVAQTPHVRRLVLLSSAKVSGETSGDRPFTAGDVNPPDEYARSKWEAEEALRGTLPPSRYTIVRTPLVYGPGVRANFLTLMKRATWPLPLGGARNARSLIFVRNLADALLWLSDDDRAAGATLFVSDFEDVSTAELIRRLARLRGRSSHLLPVPAAVLRLLAGAVGKGAALEKALGSLRVDVEPVRALGWQPPFTMEAGLAETARWLAAMEGGR